MPLTTHNHFRCDLKKPNGEPDCNVEFCYEPGIQGQPHPLWTEETYAALKKVVFLTHPLTGHSTCYCSDLHAVEALGRGAHLPPLPKPDLTAHATDADVQNAARAKAVVDSVVRTMPRRA